MSYSDIDNKEISDMTPEELREFIDDTFAMLDLGWLIADAIDADTETDAEGWAKTAREMGLLTRYEFRAVVTAEGSKSLKLGEILADNAKDKPVDEFLMALGMVDGIAVIA